MNNEALMLTVHSFSKAYVVLTSHQFETVSINSEQPTVHVNLMFPYYKS
jgi:hypothetical protein